MSWFSVTSVRPLSFSGATGCRFESLSLDVFSLSVVSLSIAVLVGTGRPVGEVISADLCLAARRTKEIISL